MEHTTCPILGPSFGGKPEKLGSENQYIPSQIRLSHVVIDTWY
jgi:hypothetical protein